MGRDSSVSDDGTAACDVVEAGTVMDAFALREQYLKSGQNQAGAEDRRRGEKGEYLSAGEFLDSFGDANAKAGPDDWLCEEEEGGRDQKSEDRSQKSEDRSRKSEERSQKTEDRSQKPASHKQRATNNTQRTSNIQHRTWNIEPAAEEPPPLPSPGVPGEGEKGGEASRLRTHPHPAFKAVDLESLPSPGRPDSSGLGEGIKRYDIGEELGKAWARVAPKILADLDERAARLARRRLPVLMRPPRGWCLCIRAADTRINSFTAVCAPSDAGYPRSHLGPGVEFVPERHDVTITKSLLRQVCAPVYLVRGGNFVQEVAEELGMSAGMVGELMNCGVFGVRRVKGLAGRHGLPVPLLSCPWPLDSSSRNCQPPDPLWAHHWPILCSHVPEDFSQSITRVPTFGHGRSAGKFRGWKWLCPGCKAPAKRLYYPVSPKELVLLEITGLERDEVDELPEYPPTLACKACHRVQWFSRLGSSSWNQYVAWVSGGWLYGHEVERPPDYHLAPGRLMLVPTAMRPNEMAPRISARKKAYRKPRRASPGRNEVAKLFLRGLGSREIAREAGITENTARSYLRRLRLIHQAKGLRELFEALRSTYPELAKDGPEVYGPPPRPRRPYRPRPRPAHKRLAVEGLLRTGKGLREIARELGLTQQAVRCHVQYLRRRHNVPGREELVAKLRADSQGDRI